MNHPTPWKVEDSEDGTVIRDAYGEMFLVLADVPTVERIVKQINAHDKLVTMLQEVTDRYARADKILVEDYKGFRLDDVGPNGTIERVHALLKEVA